jgi:RNA polymerase sigma-70 factor (ECF subfamily)
MGGDKAAGERFVTSNYPRIYRLLRSLAGSSETAEDLTQQTFARAWQGLAGYQGRSCLSTWLHKIAYHEYTQWLRSRRDHAPLSFAEDIEDLREARGLDSIMVSRALSRLAPDLRDTFVLYYMQEFSVAEVGELLDLPPGTVKSRLFAARQRLRELLQAADAPVAHQPATDISGRLLVSGVEGGTRP